MFALKCASPDRLSIVALTVAVLLAPSPTFAQGIHRIWRYDTMGSWHAPENWDPSGVPGVYDTAIVNQGTVFISSGDPAYCWELQMGSLGGSVGRLVIDSPGASLLLSGENLYVGMAGEGTLTHTAGLVGPAPLVQVYTIWVGDCGDALWHPAPGRMIGN